AHVTHNVELVLVGIATAVALAGIAIGWAMNRGPLQDKDNAPAEQGAARVLANAYGVDAFLDKVVVRPLNAFADRVLGRGVDRGGDRAFAGCGTVLPRMDGLVGTRVQDGDVGKYAWVLAAGAVLMLAGLYFA